MKNLFVLLIVVAFVQPRPPINTGNQECHHEHCHPRTEPPQCPPTKTIYHTQTKFETETELPTTTTITPTPTNDCPDLSEKDAWHCVAPQDEELGYFCPQDSDIYIHPHANLTRFHGHGHFQIKWHRTPNNNFILASFFKTDELVTLLWTPIFKAGETPSVYYDIGSTQAKAGEYKLQMDPTLPNGLYSVVLATSESDWFFFSRAVQICH